MDTLTYSDIIFIINTIIDIIIVIIDVSVIIIAKNFIHALLCTYLAL